MPATGYLDAASTAALRAVGVVPGASASLHSNPWLASPPAGDEQVELGVGVRLPAVRRIGLEGRRHLLDREAARTTRPPSAQARSPLIRSVSPSICSPSTRLVRFVCLSYVAVYPIEGVIAVAAA